MDIESMVQNSALLKAREGGQSKGRSWKWKDMLRFPHISLCTELRATIERDYYSLCVKQPIGRKLFQLFCQSQSSLQNHVSLLDQLDSFETKSDEERKEFGKSIIQNFFSGQSNQFVPIMEKYEQTCRNYLKLAPCDDIFAECREELHEHLSQEPFTQYMDSMYFDRFLQWKMLERQPVTKHNFRQYRLLGKGGFGEVWACQVRATGMMYACKKLEKTNVKKWRGETMALNEKEILEELDSRFVVNLVCTYETKHSLCMVLTMMSGGDLRFHIHKLEKGGLSVDRVRFYAAEVCCGLIHLHQRSIVYRDLKPENILLDDNGHIRISDLGLAVRLTEGKLVRGRVGTLFYMAPEVIGQKKYGMSADWWGLGCLIYEMIAGQAPFRAKGERPEPPEMERRIQDVEEVYSQKFSVEAEDLCRKLLIKEPTQRLGCVRLGGREVKSHPFFKQINFRMLEGGLVEPPFKPDHRLVYCNDVQDIDEFSPVRGVTLNQKDSEFYAKFNTGRNPIPWQKEILETGCFEELNVFDTKGIRTPDLEPLQVTKSPKRSLLRGIFRKQQQPPSYSPEVNRNDLISNEG